MRSEHELSDYNPIVGLAQTLLASDGVVLISGTFLGIHNLDLTDDRRYYAPQRT